jgi:segregation and condensation protein A
MEDNTPQVEAEVEKGSYEIKLEVFEGPLDLLLYLIRKDELDIYDIPLAHITAQYLRFLDQPHRLNLEQASEFILMAATLMKIKSQMILPRDEILELEEGEDPREELVRRLLEYQQFKEIADWLGLQKQAQRDIYLRQQRLRDETGEPGSLQPVSLFDLLKVYKHVLDTVPPNMVHQIVEERYSVDECISRVLAVLEQRSRVRFFELIQGGNRDALVATFIGLLELLKSQKIHVQQAKPFDEIWIEKRAEQENLTGAVQFVIPRQEDEALN